MKQDDPNPFKVGENFKLNLGLYIYKIHIVGIIEENMVVFRYYGKHKQWWHYEIVTAWVLNYRIEDTMDRIKIIKDRGVNYDNQRNKSITE